MGNAKSVSQTSAPPVNLPSVSYSRAGKASIGIGVIVMIASGVLAGVFHSSLGNTSLYILGGEGIGLGLIVLGVKKGRVSSEVVITPSKKRVKVDSPEVAAIKKARDQGLKVNLFLGRRNDQSTPNEKGAIWFTLDRATLGDQNLDRHLEFDFNSLQMKNLDGLFDKVVVDISVLKFMHGPKFRKLHALLTKNGELVFSHCFSTEPTESRRLVFDGEEAVLTKPTYLDIDYSAKQDAVFAAWVDNVTPEKANVLYGEYKASLSDAEMNRVLESSEPGTESRLLLEFKWHIIETYHLLEPMNTYEKEMRDAIKTHLEVLFEEVSLFKGPYPYRTEFEEEYWVVKKPTPQMSPYP